jgi:hypothetical protein
MDIAQAVPGEYRGNVGMGRIEVRLPPGHEAWIRASSGIGKSRIDYPQGPETSSIKVRVETGIGEASVKERLAATGDVPPGVSKPQRSVRTAASRRREAEEMRVLQLLEQGRITSAEAADLIAALHGAGGGTFEE